MENQFRVVTWSRKPQKSGTYLKISQISLEHLPREHWKRGNRLEKFIHMQFIRWFWNLFWQLLYIYFFAGIDCVAFIDCIFAKIMYYCIFIPCNFTKNNIRPWVFLKFYITQMVPNGAKRLICNLRALVYHAV